MSVRQICLMDDHDIENIDWERYESNESEDESDDDVYNFQVKMSEEQKENFEISPGFEVGCKFYEFITINNNF